MEPATTESEKRPPRWFWERDFVSYPTNRIVGTLADVRHTEAAIDELLQAGFEREDIEVLHGEEGLHRLDLTGDEHGVLAQFQRKLIDSVGDFPERSLKRHAADLRAGKFVVMVLAKKPQKRLAAAEILNVHAAESVGYFGRWYWESLVARRAPSTARDPMPGQMYEADVAGAVTRLRFLSEAAAAFIGAAHGTPDAVVVPMRPGMAMLSWTAPDGTPVVHVHDYENGRAYAVVARADGSVGIFSGVVQRLT